jgi:DNA-binding NarL/FixJ family response regulator
MRLAGLASVFDEPRPDGGRRLVPVVSTMQEMLMGSTLEYLVLDLLGPGSGARTIQAVLRVCPGIRIVVLGQQDSDDLVIEAISAGARAYIDLASDIELVRQAIDVVVDGSIWAPRRLLSILVDRLLNGSDSSLPVPSPQLTVREKQVVELIMAARSNGEISRRLGIGAQTVTAHVGRVMRKTGTANRIHLASFMRQHPGIFSDGNSQRDPGEMHAMRGNNLESLQSAAAQAVS